MYLFGNQTGDSTWTLATYNRCNSLIRGPCENRRTHLSREPFITSQDADDMILATSSIYELQCLIWMCDSYANQKRYIIHPDKSVITPFNIPIQESAWIHQDLQTEGAQQLKSDSFSWDSHLDIQRSNIQIPNSLQPVVECKLTTASKAMYALMGVGMYGRNGLPSIVSLYIYNIFIIHRLT